MGDADAVEHLDGAPAGCAAGLAGVAAVGVSELFADGVVRGEGGERVLEDHGDASSADASHVPVGGAGELDAVEGDGAGDDGLARVVEAEDGQEVTDFPDPDSPTMASVFWRWRSKLRPSTAVTSPSLVAKRTVRSVTDRRGLMRHAPGGR
ncbi:hypothetical protein GCM10025734_04330 [Kitasatospora paranensis]